MISQDRMILDELTATIQQIVRKAEALKDTHTSEKGARVNYACIFSHRRDEFEALLDVARQIGAVLKETPSGLLFKIPPLETVAGPLQLLKIRMPDPTRLERGDADFTVVDYPAFRAANLGIKRFKLIERPTFEMIELIDPDFDVRAYFSHPPLDQQFGLV